MSQETTKCPICFHPGCEEILEALDSTIGINCPNCGQFTYDRLELGYWEDDEQFHKLAPALALERKLAGNDGYSLRWDAEKRCVCIGAVPFLENYPKTFPEKLDRVLLNLANKVRYEPIEAVDVPEATLVELSTAALVDKDFFRNWNDFNTYTNLFFADIGNDRAIKRTLEALEKEDFVETETKNPRAFGDDRQVLLTLKGVQRALELRQNYAGSKKAFLAMWFSDTLKPYVDAATEAARQAGYILEPVNSVHHNGQIMDKVMNMINDARFVISDLTCGPENKNDKGTLCGGVRGGFYFEAGYAKGQGKEVILTCRDDSESSKRIHFDLKQVNTIFWQEQDGNVVSQKQPLVDVLRERIIYTVGKGPLFNAENLSKESK